VQGNEKEANQKAQATQRWGLLMKHKNKKKATKTMGKPALTAKQKTLPKELQEKILASKQRGS